MRIISRRIHLRAKKKSKPLIMENLFATLHFSSPRLSAQALQPADAATLFAIYSDREAMKYRGSPPMSQQAEAYTMIAQQAMHSPQMLKLRLGLRTKVEQVLIGTLLLRWHEAAANECEIGFSFGKSYWGKGYGKETLRMVEEQLRLQDRIDIITAWSVKQNLASVRIFTKAGFRQIAQGEYPDSILWHKNVNL